MPEVRDGRRVAPTCTECGCRLLDTEGVLGHYYGDAKKDARGCVCSKYYEVILPQNDKFDSGSILAV